MPDTQTKSPIDVDFIRLFFTSPVEEEIAHRWASRLSRLIGSRALDLRPDTTLAQVLEWSAASGVDSIDFVVVFEPELRMDFAEFLDNAEQAEFREIVQHYARRFEPDR
jgi:hypothetical protein